jgi:hypothetical protein
MMNPALVLLQTGVTLVALIEQLEYEPSVHLRLPHTISGKTKIMLTPWPEHSVDEHILFKSDSLLTVCEPSDELRSAYLKKIGMKESDFNQESQSIILNEEENIVDEYEPRYVEES